MVLSSFQTGAIHSIYHLNLVQHPPELCIQPNCDIKVKIELVMPVKEEERGTGQGKLIPNLVISNPHFRNSKKFSETTKSVDDDSSRMMNFDEVARPMINQGRGREQVREENGL